MNGAHLHIVTVHFPIVLAPLGAIVLAFSLYRKNSSLQNFAHILFVFISLSAIAAFLLGEGAEEKVEHLAGILKSTIHTHEEAAEISLWLCVALGILSAIKLTGDWLKLKLSTNFNKLVLVLSLAASASLAYSGYQGGKIRHPEAYNDTTSEIREAE